MEIFESEKYEDIFSQFFLLTWEKIDFSGRIFSNSNISLILSEFVLLGKVLLKHKTKD